MNNSSKNSLCNQFANLYINDISPLYLIKGKTPSLNFDFDANHYDNGILNFTGYCLTELKIKALTNIAKNAKRLNLIVTNSDILAYDDYLVFMKEWTDSGKDVIFFYSEEFNTISEKRIKNSVERLSEKGIKVHYCSSLKALKACIKKLRKINVVFKDAYMEEVGNKKSIKKEEIELVSEEVEKENKPKLTLIHCDVA